MRRAERGGIFLRFLSLLVFLAFLALLYVVRHPLLRLAGQLWLVDEPAESADAIVVLGDDNYTGDRAAHAAELYRAGLAPQVVASGRLLRPYAGISEMIERDLESRGVPAASIVSFPHRTANTREEAEALTGLAGESRLEASSGGDLELPCAAHALHFWTRVSARRGSARECGA